MTRHLPTITVLAAAALLLTACGGTPEQPERTLSPIDVYLLAGSGTELSAEERDADGDAWLRENEELIAGCMKDAGFEYVPHAPTPMGFDFNMIGSADLDNPEWIKRYGYGIVTSPDRSDKPTVVPNPNDAIVEALTDAERTEYYRTLTGGESAYGADGSYDPSKGGCFGAAQIELDARDPLRADEFRPLLDAINDFYLALDAQPEIVALDAQWAECMSTAGYGPYGYQMEPLGEINGELLRLINEGGADAWADPAVERLAVREIELATADFECREETGYRASYASVRNTLEERFVEDNRADLEAYKATAEQAGAAR